MGQNVEAFERLKEVIEVSKITRKFTRGQLIAEPVDDADEIVGHGLDRSVRIQKKYRGTLVKGLLSVQAVMADTDIPSALQFGGRFDSENPLWRVRSQLKLVVPESVQDVKPGIHTATALYLLTAEDPARIDNHFATKRAVEAQNGIDFPEDQYAFVITDDVEIHAANYTHQPGDPKSLASASPRTDLFRYWQDLRPQADGMAMLSPTDAGGIDETELPRTIGWLMNQRSI